MSRRVRIACLLLTALLLMAGTPGAHAEPGKDPNGKSEQAPGQQKDKPHGHDDQDEDKEDQDWRLNLILDDLGAINGELLHMVEKHVEAGVPVTVEPGPDLVGADPEDFGPLQDYLPSPSAAMAAPRFGPGGSPMSASDCDALIIGVMEKPPFISPGVRPECLNMDANLPLTNGADKPTINYFGAESHFRFF